MSWSRVLVLALSTALLATPAFGDDDDLSPLAPTPKKKPAAPAPKPKPKPAPVVKKAPLPPEDDLAPLGPQKGELILKLAATSVTKRAAVTIDEKEQGLLPLGTLTLTVGEHNVSVKAPGYAAWSKKLVVSNKPTEVTVTLVASAALLSVTSDVSGAEVVINGTSIGTTPINDTEVPPGSATLVVKKEGHQDATQTLTLVAGKEYPLTVKVGPAATTTLVASSDRPEATTLTPTTAVEAPPAVTTGVDEPGPIYTRWYFWVGAAAVVAAVAVGTVVGVQASKPKTLGENEICGGKCDACIGFACASGILKF